VLPPGSGLGNPIDCFPSRNAAQISRVIEILNSEEADALDYIALVLGDSGLSDNWQIYEALIQSLDSTPMPIFPSFCTAVSSHTALERFREAGQCYFEDEVSMARAMGRMVNRPRISESEHHLPGYHGEKIRSLLAGVKGPAPAGLTQQALAAAGIPTPAQAELHAQDELDKLKDVIPFPWVMKVVGPLHKSDVGGVVVGIQSLADAHMAWDRLAHIDDADGCWFNRWSKGPR
jgi:acyl-CoA synthetase (NDP forming)